MKNRHLLLGVAFAMFALKTPLRASGPLKLLQTIKLAPDITGHFDHFGVDLNHDRLFATPIDHKSVEVFNIRTGEHIYSIGGIIGEPHAVLYRDDLNKIYVTDGAGWLRIIDGDSYEIVQNVELLPDASSMGYDQATKYLYIDNGGKEAGLKYSMLSIVDTTKAEKVAEIKMDSTALEAMALESKSRKMYVNNRSKNEVAIIDRKKRYVVGSWPITLGRANKAMALDEANHRLFVGCRSGVIVVLDTESGKEMQALPITKMVDDMVFDRASKRIYAAGDGDADVYEEIDPNHYKFLGKVVTGPLAKTACLVPELERYFVAVPNYGNRNAEILVYKVK